MGSISWRGKCARCSDEANRENFDQMIAHSGPNFEHWRRRLAASVGAVLLDDNAA